MPEITRQELESILSPASSLRLPELTRRLAEGCLELLDSWRCFHCGFETSNRREAAGHFGDCDDVQPLCLIWAELTDQGRLAECQNVSGQLAEEREENYKLRTKIEGLEYRVDGQLSEIHSFKPFRSCDTIHQVFNVYDSMEGRALAAEEQRDELRSQVKELLADKERLDWLRGHSYLTLRIEDATVRYGIREEQYYPAQDLREAIDAARAQGVTAPEE